CFTSWIIWFNSLTLPFDTIPSNSPKTIPSKIIPSKTMSDKIAWTAEAQTKLKDIPFFVRPFALKKIEKYALDNNFEAITLEVYEAAKKQFNKKYD
ncbi:MAG: PCP reductase family protein, partial [Pseudanabaenaceae cyanobacterium]